MALASGLRRILTGSSISSSTLSFNRSFQTLPSPKLFVSGISRFTTDEKLREAFSPFGQLVDAKVVTDRASGRSKGFAFVTYATIEEAEKAREEMNAKYLDGWVIFVDPAKPRTYRPPSSSQPRQETSDLGFRTNKTVGWSGRFNG